MSDASITIEFPREEFATWHWTPRWAAFGWAKRSSFGPYNYWEAVDCPPLAIGPSRPEQAIRFNGFKVAP